MAGLQSLPLYHPAYWPTWAGLVVMRLISLLPMRLIWLLGMGLGAFIHLFPSKLKRIALTNVRVCFPDKGEAWQRTMVRRHFRNLGVSILS